MLGEDRGKKKFFVIMGERKKEKVLGKGFCINIKKRFIIIRGGIGYC